jgi:hypothetical protein
MIAVTLINVIASALVVVGIAGSLAYAASSESQHRAVVGASCTTVDVPLVEDTIRAMRRT